MQGNVSLFFRLFLFRLLVCLLFNTPEHPDEYWQCQEPAYHFVYGRGYLTYEWIVGMRSYVFLLPYIAGVALAKRARLLESYLGSLAFLARSLESWLLWHWRPLMAAFIAATVDLYTLKLARRVMAPGGTLDRWVLLVMLTNSTLTRSLVRSYSNCTEAMLSLVALHLWPMKAADWSQRRFGIALLIVGWATLIRASALQSWILPGLAILSFTPLSEVLSILIPAVVGVFAFGLAVDRIGYGRWVLSAWNFVYWNVWRGVSTEYGVSPPTFYFKHLVTVTLSSSLLFFGAGLWQAAKRAQSSKEPLLFPLTHLALPTLMGLSAVGHKEPRFMLPVVPILLVYCAYGLQQMHLFTQKRHCILKRLFWTAVLLSTGQQLYYTALSLQKRFFDYKKMTRDVQEILDRDPNLDQSSRCNGGVYIFGLFSRGPNMGIFNRPVPIGMVEVIPREIELLFKREEHEKEDRIFAKSMLFEPVLRNMQMRGEPMPAVLIIATSYFGTHNASTEVLEAAGYRKCGTTILRHTWVHSISRKLLAPYFGWLEEEESEVYAVIFCKRHDTLIPDNYLCKLAA